MLALRSLAGVCLTALNSFASHLAEDDAAIDAAIDAAVQGKAQPMTADVLLATQFRAEKKRMLHSALQALAARIKVGPAVPRAHSPPSPSPPRGT